LFYEPSTRTRMSFELAAKRLSADTVNFSVSSSSVVKGESCLVCNHMAYPDSWTNFVKPRYNLNKNQLNNGIFIFNFIFDIFQKCINKKGILCQV